MPLLDVILGYDCNLACDYCTITEAMRARSLAPRAVVSELRRGRTDGYDRVSFTGGEPTIRGDLVPLVREAARLAYSDIKVQSNGLLFAHRPNLDRLVDAGVNRLHVSIHTHDPLAYDDLVRRHGTYAHMVEGLDHAIATGLPVTADVILKKDTVPKLQAAVAWLADRGVRSIHLWLVSLTDQNRDNVASLPRITDVVPHVAAAFRFGEEHGIEILSLHLPRCLLGPDDNLAHAWDPGSDDVRVVTPDATFELSSSRLAGHVHVAACEGCRHREICPGLRPDYLEVYGDGEVAAVRDTAPSVSPTRSLPITPRR